MKQNSMDLEIHNSRRRLRSHEDIEENLDYPFWLRLRSLGVPSDEDTLLAALTCKNMNIDEKSKPDCDDVFGSTSKLLNTNQTSTEIQMNPKKQRSSSVTEADETFEHLLNSRRIKRSISLEDKKPDWLLALYQMKQEKLSHLNSSSKEEIAALVSGNKFYNSKRSHLLNVKYQPRNYRLIRSHRHTVVGMTNELI
ncbi:unnamed protein product [Heterobilharzia americana]|nr:unnamed protein product [Heterobilharzia americana]